MIVPAKPATELTSMDEEAVQRTPTVLLAPAKFMKILFVIDQYFDVMGGTEQHLLFLCQNLPRKQAEVELAAMTAIRRCEHSIFGVPVRILQSERKRFGWGFIQRTLRLSRLIRKQQIDLVQAFCPISELAAILATRMARRGRVIGVRRNIGYWHKGWTLWRSRLVARWGCHFVANCHAAKQYAKAHEWIDERKITVIHNPVDLSRLHAAADSQCQRQDFGIGPTDPVVAIVANVRPIKNHSMFLQAARLILDRIPRARFLIVGDFQTYGRESLLQQCAALGISEQIIWTGTIENTYDVLRWVNVGVLCSDSEGYSNALLEYSAAGIPAVTTDVGGCSEQVIDGATGYLVDAGDYRQMAIRVTELIENPALAQSMGAAGRQRSIQNGHPDRVIEKYLGVYQSALSRPI